MLRLYYFYVATITLLVLYDYYYCNYPAEDAQVVQAVPWQRSWPSLTGPTPPRESKVSPNNNVGNHTNNNSRILVTILIVLLVFIRRRRRTIRIRILEISPVPTIPVSLQLLGIIRLLEETERLKKAKPIAIPKTLGQRPRGLPKPQVFSLALHTCFGHGSTISSLEVPKMILFFLLI